MDHKEPTSFGKPDKGGNTTLFTSDQRIFASPFAFELASDKDSKFFFSDEEAWSILRRRSP